jgi:hypothetical protein
MARTDYHYVGCDCYTGDHFIKFTVYTEEDMPVLIEMWSHTLTWKERLSVAWDILRGREYMYSGIMAGKEALLDLKDFIEEKISED